VSLSPKQCQDLFDEKKEALLSKYRFAIEQALAKAEFLASSSMLCLQAFALFLICVRHCDDSRTVWSLGGLAVHLGQAIGIHRDGSNFGLNPFDTEMRRRLWWHISLLDCRSAEDHGTDPTFTDQFYDTKMPMNYNDEDIYPGMTEYPPERKGATEMTFCLVRFELSVFMRRCHFPPRRHDASGTADWTVEEKERIVDDCHRKLDERYLQYCDMDQPLLWVTATVSRLVLAKMWLLIHHPRSVGQTRETSTFPPEIRDRLFMTSVEVIEFSHVLESSEKTAKWGWLFRTYMQWQSIAFILSELCTRPPGHDFDRAWRAIDSIYDEHMSKIIKSQRGLLWKPLRQLLSRATIKRKAEQRKAQPEKGGIWPELPSLITPTRSTQPKHSTQDHPTGVISAQLEVYGMDMDMDLDESAREGMGVAFDQFIDNGEVSATAIAFASGSTFESDTSGTGINWTGDSGQESESHDQLGGLSFDMPPGVEDYENSAQQEAFSRFLFNVAGQWF
jgi:hypothetical protein